MMWLLVILLFLFLFLCWILFASFQIEIDTRVPAASLTWYGIGHAAIWFDESWLADVQVLFFHKQFELEKLKKKQPKAAATIAKEKKSKRMKPLRLLKKGRRVLSSFNLKEWKLVIDTGDFVRNAQLYPLNYITAFNQHLQINFKGENYLVLKLQNRAFKIIYAFLR